MSIRAYTQVVRRYGRVSFEMSAPGIPGVVAAAILIG